MQITRYICAIVFLGLLLAAIPVAGQETRGTIAGLVLDPQDSAVAGAAVTVLNADTNTSVRLTTNETGYYEATLLMPGNYEVSAESPGFKKLVRRGLVLAVSSRLDIPLKLEVGAVAESVVVSAEAPILDVSTVSSGRVLDNRNLMDLPVLSNSPILLVRMAPGVQTSGINARVGLHSTQGGSDYSATGNVGGNEWSMDGVPNTGGSRRVAYIPYSDTVQEFKVETSNFDAAVGHTTGISVSMITKSGTNQFHGGATEQHWQQRWNGSPFFVKQLYWRNIAAAEARGDAAAAAALRAEDLQASGRSNNYSASIGGPVILPKIFNGKDRLFFFVSFTGVNDARTERADSITYTIPTMANRQGDFSQLLNVDAARYQIYDPLTVRPDPARPTHYIRDPIPGNLLPQSRIVNPAYKAYLNFLPQPNNDPGNPRLEPTNNLLAVGTPNIYEYYALHNRVDYQHSARHRFFGRWSWNDFLEDRTDWTYQTFRGLHTSGLSRRNLGGTIDWVYTIGPSTVLDIAVAANEFTDGNKVTVPMQFKPSDVGLPAYMDAFAGDQHILPQMTFSGYQSISRNGVPSFTRYRLVTTRADLSHIRGSHTLRAGYDLRQHYRTGGGGGNTSGIFGFSNQYTRRNDDTFTPAGNIGHSWAAFMMGMPNSLAVATTDSYALNNPYMAWYAQDNWRLTPTLTLNLGLRLEYEMGVTERYNRAIAYFDPSASLPIAEAAQAAYARTPVTELAAANFTVAGGTVFAGEGGRRNLNRNELMWLPRVSAAWQANSKTVLRAGYGIFFDTINVLNRAVDQTGYSRSTSTTPTNDFGTTWLAGDPARGVPVIADPFPVRANGTRFDVPTGSALGLMARAGRGWSYNAFEEPHARQQRWRIGLQRQLASNLAVEIAYAGSYSDRIPLSRKLDPLPEQYWASGLVRNDAVASNLSSNVTNPFRLTNFEALRTSSPLVYQDMSTASFFTSATIQKNRLLRPYPHMNGLTMSNAPDGKARSHALEMSVERRFAHGFNLSAGYTRLRLREADFYFNEFDPAPSWRESSDGRPHRFYATSIFELPFGRGRRFVNSGPLAWLVGGFQFGVTYEWQPGQLLEFGNLFYYGELGAITTGSQTLDRWFNTDAFERVSSRQPNSYHRRVFPTRIDNLRTDMTNQWNANIQREFKLFERLSFQVRLDAINLQNRSQFAGPNVSPTSTDFGRVTSQTSATNRFVQLQGRIRF